MGSVKLRMNEDTLHRMNHKENVMSTAGRPTALEWYMPSCDR